MTSVHISSGLVLQWLWRLNTSVQASFFIDYDVWTTQFRPRSSMSSLWCLLTTLQAPFIKEKKGVRFSAPYLRKKRNLLSFDHSQQYGSCFLHVRSVIKWIYSSLLKFVFTCSFKNGKLRMQFMRGRRVNKLHDWVYSYSHAQSKMATSYAIFEGEKCE